MSSLRGSDAGSISAAQIRTALGISADDINNLTGLDASLALKADQTALTALDTEVDGKADASALAAKADQTALDALDAEVDAIGTPIYRDVLDGTVAASLARRKSVRIDENGNAYIVEPHYNPATDATGTWSEYTNTNYEGVHIGNPYVRGATNHFYYNPDYHHFYRSDPRGAFVEWVQTTPENALGSNIDWLGEFDDEADAINAIETLDTNLTYYAYFDSAVRVLDNATYVAPTTPSTDLIWSRIGADESRRLNTLENQTLARHVIDIEDFQNEGNMDDTFTIDVSAIRAFLSNSRGFALLSVNLTYNASATGGDLRIRANPGSNIVDSGWVDITQTGDRNFTANSDTLVGSDFTSDTIDVTIELRQRPNGSNVLFSGIEVRIITGFLPTANQLRTVLGVQNASDFNNMLVGASINGNVITFPQADGTNVTVTVPSGGTADGTLVHRRVTPADLTITENGVETVDIDVTALRQFLSTNARARAFLKFSATAQRTGAATPAGVVTQGLYQSGSYVTQYSRGPINNAAHTDGNEIDVSSLSNNTLQFRVATSQSPAGAVWTISNIAVDLIAIMVPPDDALGDGVVNGISRAGRIVTLGRSKGLSDLTLDLGPYLDALPVRFAQSPNDQTIANNGTASINIDVSDLRAFLSESDSAQGVIRVDYEFGRSAGQTGGLLRGAIYEGSTERVFDSTAPVLDDYVEKTITLNVTALGEDTLELRFTSSGTGIAGTWTIQNINISVLSGLQPEPISENQVISRQRFTQTTPTTATGDSQSDYTFSLPGLRDLLNQPQSHARLVFRPAIQLATSGQSGTATVTLRQSDGTVIGTESMAINDTGTHQFNVLAEISSMTGDDITARIDLSSNSNPANTWQFSTLNLDVYPGIDTNQPSYAIFNTVGNHLYVELTDPGPIALSATPARSNNIAGVIQKHPTINNRVQLLQPGTYEVTTHLIVNTTTTGGEGSARSNYRVQVYDITNAAVLDDRETIGYVRGYDADLNHEGFDSHHIFTITAPTDIQLRVATDDQGTNVNEIRSVDRSTMLIRKL